MHQLEDEMRQLYEKIDSNVKDPIVEVTPIEEEVSHEIITDVAVRTPEEEETGKRRISALTVITIILSIIFILLVIAFIAFVIYVCTY